MSWNGVQSGAFPVSRGVQRGRGGGISPILFTLYIDDLLYELEQSGVGCFWDDQFVSALTYADDLTLLAPSPAALRRLLFLCKQCGAANTLKFNPDKTQCIRFSHSCTVSACNLMDNTDIPRDFCKQANSIFLRFGFCDPVVQTKLLLNYCMSLYGCALRSHNCSEIKHLDVCLNNCLRRIWSLPPNTHTGIVHCVSGCVCIMFAFNASLSCINLLVVAVIVM